ncbi:MAG: type II toxin-antitoxin system RelE/ParE family toxin [Caldilineaceae bacterium SB0666_bin_21]|nr:type II toxin-antitoxin system RelE/ParE family toxin [Caldilineaceae bacterium SB0666_bin_21]
MFTVLRSTTFDQWLSRLRDRQAVNRIIARLLAAQDGHLGDVRVVGSGVSETGSITGSDTRSTSLREAPKLIVLLGAGDNDSQRRDIGRTKRMAKEWRNLCLRSIECLMQRTT